MTAWDEARVGGVARQAVASLLLTGLAGCASGADQSPGGQQGGIVGWWHRAEGGPIADQRPPPPGADAPYPNLSVVPPRPKPLDPAIRAETSAALAADRARATYETATDPLAAAPPRTRQGLFAAAPPAPAPSADAAGAALDATAPPPRPQAPGRSIVDTPPPQIAPDGPPPPMPDQPPPPPRLAGVSIPVTIPHLPPRMPVRPQTLAALSAAESAALPVAFSPGSAIVPPDQRPALRSLAFRRGRRGIEIVGFGEADGKDPQSQIAGVQLGLERARAVAAVLVGQGSPAAGMRLAAQADGRGAAARLIQ